MLPVDRRINGGPPMNLPNGLTEELLRTAELFLLLVEHTQVDQKMTIARLMELSELGIGLLQPALETLIAYQMVSYFASGVERGISVAARVAATRVGRNLAEPLRIACESYHAM